MPRKLGSEVLLDPLPVHGATNAEQWLHRGVGLIRQVANDDIADLLVVVEETGNRTVDIARRGAVTLIANVPP